MTTLATSFVVAFAGLFFAENGLGADTTTSVKIIRPIPRENDLDGSKDWQLTRVRLDTNLGFRTPWIEGYCSKQSVEAGQSIDIMVSTDPPRPFKIEIFRTGYYAGRGARLMTTLGPFPGQTQQVPKPGEKNLHECRWQATSPVGP